MLQEKKKYLQTLTLKNFIPMSKDIMLWVVWGEGSFASNSFNSVINFLRTDINLDCANAPMTSAYKSATMCIFPAFGPLCKLHKR